MNTRMRVEYKNTLPPSTEYPSDYRSNRNKYDCTCLTLISMKNADSRLEKSDYYLNNKKEWFNYLGNNDLREKINGFLDFDPIEKTENEKRLINYITNKYSERILKHGWYEVAY